MFKCLQINVHPILYKVYFILPAFGAFLVLAGSLKSVDLPAVTFDLWPFGNDVIIVSQRVATQSSPFDRI